MTDPMRDATWARVPMSGVTELRVHGVGGTPPAVMLNTPAPRQVSGDATAGCWRGPDDVDDAGRVRHVEAYAWGGLTARSATSALWLLALPMALVNIAGWMAPVRGSERYAGVVRVAGLCVTGLYVAFACTAGMDFTAYQCAGREGCAAAGWWLIGEGGVAHDPARRVLVGALVPVLLLAVLWLATRRSRRSYERFASDDPTVCSEAGLARHSRDGLERSGFWRGEGYAVRLAEVHLALGFSIVAYLLARTALMQAGAVAATAPAAAATSTLALVLVGTAVALAAFSRLRRTLPAGLALGVSVGLLGMAAVGAWVTPGGEVTGAPLVLPGMPLVFAALIAVLMPTSVVLFVVALLLARTRTAPVLTRFRWAATPTATVAAAFMVSLTVLSGVVLWLADRLGTAGTSGSSASLDIAYAPAFEVLARGIVVVLVVFLLTVATAWLVRGRRIATVAFERSMLTWETLSAPPGWSDARTLRAWTRNLRRSLRVPQASLSALEWGIWMSALCAIPASLAYGWLWFHEWSSLGYPSTHIQVDTGWLERVPLGVCTWLLTSLPVVAILVLRRAITSPSTRRSVAIAWDVATFWPRSFHPLAPPSYAERAVPELQARLCRLWAGEDGRPGSVVLLGHSQGSVLVVAALASLDDEACPAHDADPRPLAERLSVVTYGSPVRRLYARHFPAYFRHGLVRRAVEKLEHPESGELAWRNCFRDTDYVGYTLGDGRRFPELDTYLPDPPHPFAPPNEPAPPPRSHSEVGYRHQAVFRHRVANEADRLSAAGAGEDPGEHPGAVPVQGGPSPLGDEQLRTEGVEQPVAEPLG
jgi:hypothetical protein